MSALEPAFLRPRDVAAYLSFSESEVRRLLKAGDLKAVRHGSKVLITVDECRRFAKSILAGAA
jgi:excisionase family DNA binding protein